MKKKIMAMCLVIAMAATAVIGGTLAYFTDTDGAKNVMTVGNVDIKQNEEQRKYDEKGNFITLEDFEDGKKLFPYTGEDQIENDMTKDLGGSGKLNKNEQNWLDKIVRVTNVGSEDAYVRTLFAFQNLKGADGKEIIAADPNDGDLAWRTNHSLYYDLEQYPGSVYFPKVNNDYVKYTDEDGNTYIVGEYLYKMDIGDGKFDSMLNPEEISHPSLKHIALEYYVDNEDAALYKDYKILVVSQAVQTAGFTDVNGNGVIADDALNTAFGALANADQAKLAEWFANAQ